MAFAPIFQRPFSSPFDRRAAAAAGVNWSQWFDHLWIAKGAASKAASLLDLVGSQNLSETGTVTWASAGWSGFLTTNYFDTGIVTAANYTIMARGSGGNTSDYWCMAGALSNTNGGLALMAGTAKRFWHGTTATIVSGNYTAGVLAMSGQAAYVDGSPVGTVGNTTFSGTLQPILVGVRNRSSGIPDIPWPGTIEAVGIRKSTLTDAQVAAAYAAMAAL